MTERKPPTLHAPATKPEAPSAFELRAPPRRPAAPPPDDPITPRHEPAQPPRKRRGFGSLLGLLIWALLTLIAFVLAVVVLLRWVPPPTTAFMLQSPLKPVRYLWVSEDRIADTMRRAAVASEDQKFFEHRGFDFQAIEQAMEEHRDGGRRRGASTISQQTAKNLFLWSGGGFFRKGVEAGFTVLIETLWSKQRILEVYLNIAEFGEGIYGVEAASQAYFGKSAAQLAPMEAARLAAVLPSPRRWSAREPGPYVQSRAEWILRQMGHGGQPSNPAADPEPQEPLDGDDRGDFESRFGETVTPDDEDSQVEVQSLEGYDIGNGAPRPVDTDQPLDLGQPDDAAPSPEP